jgi:hypothetical protein
MPFTDLYAPRERVHNKSNRENIRKLHKKLAASLTIAIFLLGTLAILAPVQAHFTLGDYTSTYPYHQNDFDPHVPGVIGYVWPGSGENAYEGALTTASSQLSPGYQSPWTSNPPDAPSYTWYQLAGSAYAPFGAILVNSTGDLIFAVNASDSGDAWTKMDPSNQNWGWGALDILIPPEFGNILPEQIVTTITNDYSGISVSTLSPYDRYAPGWTLVRILADSANNAGLPTNTYGTWEGWLFNSTLAREWYYVRINGVTAPSIAGKYFFKMFLGGVGPSGVCDTGCQPDYWVPVQNWPVLLVKGEIDPAIIWGNIYYGGYNTTLYGSPLEEAGMVKAVMTTKLDPYTGQALTGYPLTNAVGYFNATANGHYEVEGVAPGVYDIYAEAGGFPTQLIASGVTILKGQSLNLNGYLNPGVVIHGNVYSKHGFGEQPWTEYSNGEELYGPEQYIKIEIYDKPTVGNKVDPSAGSPVSWSPLPCVADQNHGLYVADDAYGCWNDALSNTNTLIAFPWHEYSPTGHITYANPMYDYYVDEQGVGPPQSWYVQSSYTTPFYFQFGVKGEFGAPSDLDGHVPQMNATWVNGLTPGRYYVRAWVGGYVQTEIDGATFHEVVFDVAANEWAGDITVPIDLHLTSYVVKTVHFHDTPGTLTEQYVSTGATTMQAVLEDANGVVWAWGVNSLDDMMSNQVIYLGGFFGRWDGEDYGIPSGTYTPKVYALGYVQQTFEQVSLSLSGTPVYISDHLYRGVGFNITVYSTDFEQPRVDRTWRWPGDQIDLVIYSEPAHTTADVEGGILTQDGTTSHLGPYTLWGGDGSTDYGGETSYTDIFLTSATADFTDLSTAFESGQYSFRAFTYGYVQKKAFTIYALKGQMADIKVNLVVGVNITLNIPFKTEGILTPTPYDMSARVRVFDDSGLLVGEWMSSQGVYFNIFQYMNTGQAIATGKVLAQYPSLDFGSGLGLFNFIPGGTTQLNVTIAGLSNTYGYFGDPVFDSGGFEGGDYAALQNIGIDGSPNYQGGYSVEVDFVPWYYDVLTIPGVFAEAAAPQTQWHFEPFWWLNVYYYSEPGLMPVIVPGLLLGESFHTVPGHPQNPFGWTEVGALSTDFLGHSMAPNHLGPYAQEGVWSLPNAHLSGEVSGIWEVDLRGFLSGQLVGFTWSGEFRTVSWATVSILGADGFTYNSYSYDGVYGMFANPGTYAMTIAMPGYTSLTVPMSIGTGQASYAGNLFLQQSFIPIPEFSGIAIVAFSALAASLYLLRRRRR